MQTFLPFPDFAVSAAHLDYRRLGKQRVETWQILSALTRPDYGWQNHPAVKMWRGHSWALRGYGIALLFKQPEHYSQFGWAEAPKLDYVWPTQRDDVKSYAR